MQAWKILLCRFMFAFASVMVMAIGHSEAGQIDKSMNVSALANPKPTPSPTQNPKQKSNSISKQQASPIVGELDDSDSVPMDDDDDDASADAIEATPLRSKEASNTKSKNSKNTSNLAKENEKIKKTNKKRKQLLEGFNQAEKFHQMWFHLPPNQIKTPLDKLTKFCKIACTKKQCMDDEVANNCHLMCPDSTTKQCPDPIKQAGDNADSEEVTIGNDEGGSSSLSKDDSKMASPSSIEMAERNIPEGEGEGG